MAAFNGLDGREESNRPSHGRFKRVGAQRFNRLLSMFHPVTLQLTFNAPDSQGLSLFYLFFLLDKKKL